MPYKDPETRRRKDREHYQRKREQILEQKRERQKDPAFQKQRKRYLEREDVKARRRRRENARYASDEEYRAKRKAATAAQRATPEGAERNRRQAQAWREAHPDRASKQVCRWHRKHADRMRAYYYEYKKRRLADDPQYRLAENMRSRVRKVLRRKNTPKHDTTFSLVGCSASALKLHLEQQFSPGMTWENYGEWHVDHIRELFRFDLTEVEQQKQAFHFSNLRPLWAAENLRRKRRK